VGGDFNTNPYRWVEHTLPLVIAPDQGSGVLKFMKGLGFSSALPSKTPTSRWLRMQLDWLFLRNIQVGHVEVQPVRFSDHHALYACLELVGLPQGQKPKFLRPRQGSAETVPDPVKTTVP
jgi:endonuclease/exonuclease/phosphatase (EEP) superfamily protein YafD